MQLDSNTLMFSIGILSLLMAFISWTFPATIADRDDLSNRLGLITQRLEKVLGLMESEISVLQVEKRIRTRVKRQMEKTQREYYLNEQMKAIQRELGDGDDAREDIAELEKRIVVAEKQFVASEARKKAQLSNIEKIISGRVDKYFADVCLLEQSFFRDPEKKVSDLLTEVHVADGTRITARAKADLAADLERYAVR